MTVLLQGDCRSYNYVSALSSDETGEIPWGDLMTLAKIIPRVCHNINRYRSILEMCFTIRFMRVSVLSLCLLSGWCGRLEGLYLGLWLP